MVNMIPLLAFILIASVSEVYSDRKVVVLSFAGFRADYYSLENTPKLWNLRSESAAPDHLVSIFPTKTMVTLHSVSTGLYPNVHGVYGNEIFEENDQVIKFQNIKLNDLNRNIIPIWCENVKKGRKSGIMMWPGGEFLYKDIKATYSVPYNEEIDWQTRAGTIVNWITTDCNLVMAYFEDKPCYDINKHQNHVKEHTGNVDYIIDYIYKKLQGDIDIVILSDHGVSQVMGINVLRIEEYVTDNKFPKIMSGPLVYIDGRDETQRNTLYESLRHNTDKFKAYKAETFLANWHLRGASILEDVVILVANQGFTFMETDTFTKLLTDTGVTEENFMTLENGYDINVSDMNAFFMGIGPGFKKNQFPGNVIQLMDVYPLLKVLLELPNQITLAQDNIFISNEMKKLVEPNLVSAYEAVSKRMEF